MTIVQPVTIAEHAAHYAADGWEIFPGNPRTKAPLVTHGMNDATTDPELVHGWWARWPDALICHRVPEHVVLLDVDVRHGGDQTWLKIRDEFGPLPPTRTHHSGRGDGGGHVWYRHTIHKLSTASLDEWARNRGVGQETKSGGWTAGIDLLHHGHRYTILPPSPHPDTGNPYTWKTGPDAELAELPDGLAKLLTAVEASTAANGNGTSSMLDTGDSIADWYSSTVSIDQLLEAHHWTRVGRNGNDGQRWKHPEASNAHSATVRHGCLFVYTPTPGLPVTEPGDPHGLTPFRLYALLEHHGDLSAAAATARVLKDGPRERPDLSWAQPAANDAPIIEMSSMLLPDDFWQARPWLTHIRTAAQSRALAPASVLGCVLARLAAFTSHTFVLPNPVGDPGSLNLYIAIVGPPGVGKSAGARTAAELLPPPTGLDVAIDNLGSGEGLAELYCGETKEQDADGKDRKVKKQIRWNAFVTLDEGGALTAFMGRQGNTTAAYLRSAWTGDNLGQANATKETYRNVRNYRLGFIVGFQPELAGAVLADHLAGTPQRFLWLWAVDHTNPDTPPEWPGPLTLPTIPAAELSTHEIRRAAYVRHQLTLDHTIAAQLYTRHLAKIRGEITVDPLDAHEPLHLLKLAALFAITDTRLHITTDDWSLATTIWRTSCAIRTHVATAVTAEQQRTETISIERHARREYAAEAARLAAGPAVERIARRLANWIHEHNDQETQPDDGWPKRDLNQRLNGREKKDRHVVDAAIDHAIAQQWIAETDGRYRAGESRPA